MKSETYNRELAVQSIMHDRLKLLRELLLHHDQGVVSSAKKELEHYKDKSKLREFAESVCDTIKIARLEDKYPLEEQAVIEEGATKEDAKNHPWRGRGPSKNDLKRIRINRYLDELMRGKPQEIEEVENNGSIGGTTKY